jgi:hypothetical protein
MFNPVEHPLCLESPHCVSEVSSWHHYISFALLVVALLRPRALDEGGALVFTIPMILGRLTRSRVGLPPSYHGTADCNNPEMIVHTEFGADAWTFVIRAGSSSLRVRSFPLPGGCWNRGKI